jgi:hypothetical protein
LGLRQPERLFGAGGKNRIGGGLRERRGGADEKKKNHGGYSAGFARALYFRCHYAFN